MSGGTPWTEYDAVKCDNCDGTGIVEILCEDCGRFEATIALPEGKVCAQCAIIYTEE